MSDDDVTGRFLVTADGDAPVCRDVDTGRVHPLDDDPGVAAGDVLVGTLAPVPPLDAAWEVVETDRTYRVTVEAVDESLTAHVRDLAPDEPGEVTRAERAGEGELHVLRVPDADRAVADLLDDDERLRERAARLGVERVEIRSGAGVVAVRYLP